MHWRDIKNEAGSSSVKEILSVIHGSNLPSQEKPGTQMRLSRKVYGGHPRLTACNPVNCMEGRASEYYTPAEALPVGTERKRDGIKQKKAIGLLGFYKLADRAIWL